MAGQPAPYPGDTTRLPIGTSRLERRFTDAVGSGLNGQLLVTPKLRHETDGAVITAIPFKCRVVDGLLSLDLPPGSYEFEGSLSGAAGTVREHFAVVIE